MDYKRREEIFSKEYITTQELQEILGLGSKSMASTLMTKIRYKTGDRLHIEGKIHTEDYFAYFGIQTNDRYNQLTKDRPLGETETKEYTQIQNRHKRIFNERGIL